PACPIPAGTGDQHSHGAAVGYHSRWCRPAPGSLRRRAALRCAVMLVTDPPERPVRWQGESGEDLAGDGGVGRVEAVQVSRGRAWRGWGDKARGGVAALSGEVGKGQESAMAYRPGRRRWPARTDPASAPP